MLKLKKALLIIIDLVKKTLNLEKLNHKELKGFNTSLTKLRLLSNTKVLMIYLKILFCFLKKDSQACR